MQQVRIMNAEVIISARPTDEGLTTPVSHLSEVKLAHPPLPDASSRSAEGLLHELQMYQIELEIQKETLRQAQISLEESRDRYVDLYEFAPVGYLSLTSSGLISKINLTGTKLLGVERAKLLYKHFSSLVIPENQDRWTRHFLSMKKHVTQDDVELALHRGDGTVFHVQLQCLRQEDGADNSVIIHITLSDITDRKATETEVRTLNRNLERLVSERTDELRESETRLRLAIAASNLGPWDWDLRTNTVYFSPEWKLQLGYEEHEIQGRYEEWERLMHPEDREPTLAVLRAYLDGQRPEYAVEFRLRHKDGSYRWIFTRGEALREAGGKPIRMLGCHLDITERKQAEAHALAEQAFLARDAAMRELMAHVERLREEDRKYIAREIHDELGQVLAALRLEASMLQGKGNTKDSSVDIIRHNMLALVDEAIKGIRTVAADLRPASLELGVVAAIEKLCNDFIKHTNVSCILHSLDDPIDLDQEQTTAIFRIVQESLTNVIRHAAASFVEITLTQSAGDFIIEVRDNGRGFDSANIEKKTSFGLLGIRERAAALGGSINITSVRQQGTVVSARIPIKQKEVIYDLFENC